MVSITTTLTTPITFLEYSKSLTEQDPTRTFVENMIEQSDVMRAMPVLQAQFGKRAYMDFGALPTVGFRGLNEAGGQATGAFNLREEDTFFIDEYIFVDRAIQDRLGDGHKFRQEKAKTVALSQYFSQNIVKGDNSSNPRTPNGLQVRCNTVSLNLIHNSAASGGAALSLGNLDQLYWLVNKPTHWIFPRSLMPFVDIASRSNALTNQTFSAETDNMGRNIRKYKDLPILYGYDPDDSPDLLPFTEVASGGGGAVTSSIYCVSFRDGGFYAIEQTPLSVMPEGPIPGSPFDSTHIKWDWGLAKEHPRACARLTSITAATIVA
jgi:Major capsid protein GP7